MRKVYGIAKKPFKLWEEDAWGHLEGTNDGSRSLATTVYEDEYDPVPSGVLDQHGNMISYTIIKNPIGFTHFEDPE